MEGSWRVFAPGERWSRPAFLARAVLEVPSAQSVGFELGELHVVRTVDEDQFVGHLGPDLLGPDWDAAEATRRLGAAPEVPVYVALLDQRNLAGVGNVFANEICFLRGLHPERPIGETPDLARVVDLASRLLQANKDRFTRSTTGDLRPDRPRGSTDAAVAPAAVRHAAPGRRTGSRRGAGARRHVVPPLSVLTRQNRSMNAGYSGTPQARKIGLSSVATWDVVGSAAGWRLEEPPVEELRRASGSVDVLLAFVRSAADVEPTIIELERRIFPAGALWMAWPRKAAGHVSDVTESLIRDTALARGLVDVKVAALDHDWSALKVVWRRENRA